MRTRLLKVTVAVLTVLCWTPQPVAAEVALKPVLPTVLQIFPQGATVGESVEVEVVGNFLDQAESLRLDSDALEGSVLESSVTRARIRLASRSTARSGLYSMRLLTRRGVSNLFHFRLTGWQTVLEMEPNDRREQAQVIRRPGIVHGVITHFNDSDFYRFSVEAGETLAFNLLMGRNGYATGGEVGHFTLTLMDAAGRALATNLGRFLMDPYFQHTFDIAGKYYLAVNHSRLAVTCLENECDDRWMWASYQLAIGRSPILWSVWPPAGQRGSVVEAILTADFIDESTPILLSGPGLKGNLLQTDSVEPGRYKLKIEVEETAEPGPHLLTVAHDSGIVSPLAFVVYGEGILAEQEPNDSFAQSTAIEPPALVLGRMDHARDVDSFHFASTGAESLSFRLTARNLGSEMVDPHLALLCRDGDLVAVSDDTPSFRNPRNRDAYLEFKDANAAICRDREAGYYLQVRDWSTHFGDSRFYVLEIDRQEPSFEVSLRPERIVLQRGRKNTVPITLRRTGGFTGDVTVSVEGLPDGVAFESTVITAANTAGNLEFTVAPTLPDATFVVNIYGTSRIAQKDVVRPAVLAQPMLGDGPGYVQTAQQTAFVSVVPPVEFALERIAPPGGGFALDRHTLLLSGDRKTRILLTVHRDPEFTAPLHLGIEGLPDGVVLERQEWTADGRGAELVLEVLNDVAVPAGEYRISAYASGRTGGETWTEATPGFFLRIER